MIRIFPPVRSRFTVITPCSRPGNLAEIRRALAWLHNPYGHELHWWVVFDADSAGPVPDVPGWATLGLACRSPGWGHAQTNFALDLIEEGLVWRLDDDNLPHPALLTAGYERGSITLIGQQVTLTETRIPRPAAGHVDTAQIVADRGVIGEIRWPLDYMGDGWWVEALHRAHPEAFVIDPTVRSFYNRLKWDAVG